MGFNTKQKVLAIGSIVARLLVPGSDWASFQWLQETSALGELMGFDFRDTLWSRFYEVAGQLYAKKDILEECLYQAEYRWFFSEETIILYDLTNTFFEGSRKYNNKAKFGRSKEKRSHAREQKHKKKKASNPNPNNSSKRIWSKFVPVSLKNVVPNHWKSYGPESDA